jgi:hypothetical protein
MLSGLHFSDAESLHQLSILDDILVTQISLEPAALSYQEEQATA